MPSETPMNPFLVKTFFRRLMTAFNNVLSKKNYAASFAGSASSSLLFTHSLRCGLEEYRQLCWLRSTSAQFFYQIGLFYAAADTLLEQLSFS